MSSSIAVEVNSGRDTVLGGSWFTMLAADPEHPFPRRKEGRGGGYEKNASQGFAFLTLALAAKVY